MSSKVRRKCYFNDKLKNQYPFLRESKTPNAVFCSLCLSDFSIANMGESAIKQHEDSKKHRSRTLSVNMSKSLKEQCTSKKLGSREKVVACEEGTWSYHSIVHNHSFRSMDCTSKLIKCMYNEQLSCARTKTEAILKNVFFPYAMCNLKSNLAQRHFVTLYYDASNHKSLKMIPILVRFFDPGKGIQVKLLEFQDLPGEKAQMLAEYIDGVAKKNDLQSKIAGICADNTNTNFGGKKRRGKKNVFTILNSKMTQKIVGVGCSAHMIHNSVKTAADCLPIDLECIVFKIYRYFEGYTVRTTELKEFCEFCSTEFKQILGISNTRFLALLPALERLLLMFQPLKRYFLSIEMCPAAIKQFFEDPTSEMWLFFLHSQASIFHSAVLAVEGQKTTIGEVADALADLRLNLQQRIQEGFTPLVVRSHLARLEETMDISKLRKHMIDFYKTSLTYLEEWTAPFTPFSNTKWIQLDQLLPDWTQFIESVTPFFETLNGFGVSIDDNKLFNEVTSIKAFLTPLKLTEWEASKLAVDLRWVEIFAMLETLKKDFSNVALIVEYLLALPGSNAPTERVFTTVNQIWTDEKSQLSIGTLGAMVATRMNFDLKCQEFRKFLQGQPKLLDQIHSSAKYH